MATTVAFISEKGGVGKTTACYHVAVALTRYHSKRVLIVDTDYQRGGITCRFFPQFLQSFHNGHMSGNNLYVQFQLIYSGQAPTDVVDRLQASDDIHVVPADPRLSQVTVQKLPPPNNIVDNNQRLYDHLALIRRCLEPFMSDYDYILIDSHPELSDLMRSVIFAADYCVSPVKLDAQSTIGVPSAQQAINEVNRDIQALSGLLGVPPKTNRFAGSMGMMAREYGGELIQSQAPQYARLSMSGGVFTNYVTEGDGIRQAAASRVSVYDIAGPIAAQQATQFLSVTQEFLARCP